MFVDVCGCMWMYAVYVGACGCVVHVGACGVGSCLRRIGCFCRAL